MNHSSYFVLPKSQCGVLLLIFMALSAPGDWGTVIRPASAAVEASESRVANTAEKDEILIAQLVNEFTEAGTIYLEPTANLRLARELDRDREEVDRSAPFKDDLRAAVAASRAVGDGSEEVSDELMRTILHKRFYVEELDIQVVRTRSELQEGIRELLSPRERTREAEGEQRNLFEDAMAAAASLSGRVNLQILNPVSIGLTDERVRATIERLELPLQLTTDELQLRALHRQLVQEWIFVLLNRVTVKNSAEGNAIARLGVFVRDTGAPVKSVTEGVEIPEPYKRVTGQLIELLRKSDDRLPILKIDTPVLVRIAASVASLRVWLESGSEWEGLDDLRNAHLRSIEHVQVWLEGEVASGRVVTLPRGEAYRRSMRLLYVIRHEITTKHQLDEEAQIKLAIAVQLATKDLQNEGMFADLAGVPSDQTEGEADALLGGAVTDELRSTLADMRDTSFFADLEEEMRSEKLSSLAAALVENPPEGVREHLASLRQALEDAAGVVTDPDTDSGDDEDIPSATSSSRPED